MLGHAMAGMIEVTSVLVVRAWLEGVPPRLRVRITQIAEAEGQEEVVTRAVSTDDVLVIVNAWLEAFLKEAGATD
jgi:hypothetical protein